MVLIFQINLNRNKAFLIFYLAVNSTIFTGTSNKILSIKWKVRIKLYNNSKFSNWRFSEGFTEDLKFHKRTVTEDSSEHGNYPSDIIAFFAYE